jgi:hypothetical protein
VGNIQKPPGDLHNTIHRGSRCTESTWELPAASSGGRGVTIRRRGILPTMEFRVQTQGTTSRQRQMTF